MSRQIAQTHAIEPTGDGEQNPSTTNIRRRLGNWTAPINGATAPMVADSGTLGAAPGVASPTISLDEPGSSPMQTVQHLRSGLAPESATGPAGNNSETPVRHIKSPSGPLDPSVVNTAPFIGAEPGVRYVNSPSGTLDSAKVNTGTLNAARAAASAPIESVVPSDLGATTPIAPQTVDWGQTGPVTAQTVPIDAQTVPFGMAQTAPVGDQTVVMNRGASGAETVPIGSNSQTGTMGPPEDYTVALTGGRPTAQLELEQEVTELRKRVSANPTDPDLVLEFALALNEAGQRVEAHSVLTRLAALYEKLGDVEQADRVRTMLGDSVTAPISDQNDSTRRIPRQTTGSLPARTGTLGLRSSSASRDGRIAARAKPEERERPVFPSREIEFFEELPQIERLRPEAAGFLQQSEAERLRGHFRSALDAIQMAVATDPTVPALYLRMSELQLKLGYKRKALNTADDLQRFESLFRSGIPEWVFSRLRLHAEPFELSKVQRLVDWLIGDDKAAIAAPYAARLVEHLVLAGLDAEAIEYSNRICAMAPGNTHAALEAAILSIKHADRGSAIDRWEFALRNGADNMVARSSMAAVIAESSEPDHWRLLAEVLPAYRETANDLIAVAYRRTAEANGFIPIQKGAASLFFLDGNDPGVRSALASAAGDRTGSPIGRAAAAALLAKILQNAGRGDEYLSAIRTTVSLFGDERIPANTNWVGILGFAPSVEEMSFELGEELMNAGDNAGAVEILKQGYALNKTHYRLNQALADALSKTNQLGSALTILDELAMTHRKAGQLDEMAGVLRQMSQLAPANIKVKSRLVDAYLQRGFVAEARAELVQRADLEERAGMIKEAIVSLQRAGDLSWNLGFPQESFNLYDRILALDPEDVANRSALVNLYLQVGRLSDAAEHQRAVVDLALKNGRKHEAVAALHQVIGLTPDDTTAYYQLGEELASMGEYHQAEKVYRRIVLMSPDDAIAQAKATAMGALREQAAGL